MLRGILDTVAQQHWMEVVHCVRKKERKQLTTHCLARYVHG